MLHKIHEQTAHNRCLLTADEVVRGLNRTLCGWTNYFQLGPVTKAYRLLDRYTGRRLRLWLCHKHRKSGSGTRQYPAEYIYGFLGLVRLPHLTRNFPWAQA